MTIVNKIKNNLKENDKIYPKYLYIKKNYIEKRKQKKVLKEISKYHMERYKKYSGTFNESFAKTSAYMTWLYHVVEKGIAMPNRHLGFAQDKVQELVRELLNFKVLYGCDHEVYKCAVDTLSSYNQIHKAAGFELQYKTVRALEAIDLEDADSSIMEQNVTKAEFYKDIKSEFPIFSASRHSIRNFKNEPIELNDIIYAIKLAQNAPSACNRQPARVHIVRDKEKIKKCLALQNGNRGFGQLTDTLLVCTGDLRTLLGAPEFLDLNTNVGIYIMNLSYALHYKKIAHCILNWYALRSEDEELRKILDLPNEETVVSFVACGVAPDKFKLVVSPRYTKTDIFTIH